jgi:hypothetical protein
MSTSPDTSIRADDRVVNAISRWLARHISDGELHAELGGAASELDGEAADAVEELTVELDRGAPRPELEMVARETMEAVALGL